MGSYTALLRASITYLRPKRKKTVKPAPAAAAKSKKPALVAAANSTAAGGAATFARLPKLVGPKRGAGALKRQRLKRRRETAVKKLVARRKADKQ